MKKLYCISGLGADHRVFKNVVIPGYELVPLPWVAHSPGDSLVSYARKMAEQIAEKKPTILGLSMGGMIATEIGKIMDTEKIVIVSSAKTGAEVGKRPYLLRQLAIKQILPTPLFGIPYPFMLSRLGARTREEKQLIYNVVKDANPHFVKWAVKAIVEWTATEWPANVYHIHGTADKIIPPKAVTPDAWVDGGTHLMILNRAEDVNKLISEYLGE